MDDDDDTNEVGPTRSLPALDLTPNPTKRRSLTAFSHAQPGSRTRQLSSTFKQRMRNLSGTGGRYADRQPLPQEDTDAAAAARQPTTIEMPQHSLQVQEQAPSTRSPQGSPSLSRFGTSPRLHKKGTRIGLSRAWSAYAWVLIILRPMSRVACGSVPVAHRKLHEPGGHSHGRTERGSVAGGRCQRNGHTCHHHDDADTAATADRASSRPPARHEPRGPGPCKLPGDHGAL